MEHNSPQINEPLIPDVSASVPRKSEPDFSQKILDARTGVLAVLADMDHE